MNRPEVAQELEKYSLTRIGSAIVFPGGDGQDPASISPGGCCPTCATGVGSQADAPCSKGMSISSRPRPTRRQAGTTCRSSSRGAYPVGIVVGDHDFLDFGNPLLKKWVQGIPQIELRIVKNAGHLIWVDQPERVSEELHRLLERHAPGCADRIAVPAVQQ